MCLSTPLQLNVCIALVEPLPPTPADQQAAAQAIGLASGMPPPAVDAAAAEVHAAMRAQATQCIARSIDRLVELLEAADQGRQLPTSYGLLQPPVGLPRLKAVELLAALLHSGDEAAGVSQTEDLCSWFSHCSTIRRAPSAPNRPPMHLAHCLPCRKRCDGDARRAAQHGALPGLPFQQCASPARGHISDGGGQELAAPGAVPAPGLQPA